MGVFFSALFGREISKRLERRNVASSAVYGVALCSGITSRAVFVNGNGSVTLGDFEACLPMDKNELMLHEFYEDTRLIPWMAPEFLRQVSSGILNWHVFTTDL